VIVGNGLIAKAVESCNTGDVILFASGVSNSVDPIQADFDREEKLLLGHLGFEKRFIYFSTVSIEDPDSNSKPYIQHKIRMENLVKANSDNYLILRLPNMASVRGNANTLFPYFYQALMENRKVVIKSSAYRYLLTEQQLNAMLSQLLLENIQNRTVNCIHGEPFLVEEIYQMLAQHLEIKMEYEIKEGGLPYRIDSNYQFNSIPKIDLEVLLNATVTT